MFTKVLYLLTIKAQHNGFHLAHKTFENDVKTPYNQLLIGLNEFLLYKPGIVNIIRSAVNMKHNNKLTLLI